ncbi:MAG: hypothetical protein M0042_14010, partial [Nitrospiraceae bacterium]|nr:hypothetical protein [Nitrospiraceae bacterium]
LADAFRTVDLNARIDADYPWCSLFQPLPGTELWDRCIAENLFEGGVPLLQPSFFKDSPIRLTNKNEIVNLQKLFYFAVKFPGLRRLIRRAIRLRPNAGFDFLFLLSHAWIYARSESLSLVDLVQIGSRNLGRYLPRSAARRGKGGPSGP